MFVRFMVLVPTLSSNVVATTTMFGMVRRGVCSKVAGGASHASFVHRMKGRYSKFCAISQNQSIYCFLFEIDSTIGANALIV